MRISDHPLPSHGPRKPWGVMFHTTGGGLPTRAYDNGAEPLATAREVYGGMKEGPHFVIAPDGSVERYRDPSTLSWHCGVSATDRRDYLNGAWEGRAEVSKSLVSWWKARWPGVSSPQHLYPSKTANEDYIGIELIPCGVFLKNNLGSWSPVFGAPVAGDRARFTGQQYLAAASLLLLLCSTYSIPLHGRGRVVGHEDINPLTRPGWDPDSFQGFWHWPTFWGVVAGLEKHA